MKFKIPQASMLRALQFIGVLGKSGNQSPTSGLVLLEQKNNKLNLSAADLVSSLRLSLVGEGGGDEELVVGASQFLEYIQTLESGEMVLEFEKEKIIIKQGRSRASLSTISSKDYPKIPSSPLTEGVEINLQTFLANAKRASISLGADGGRPILAGLLLKKGNGEGVVKIVGTDGYRLGVVEQKNAKKWPEDVLVPGKPLLDLLKNIDEEEVLIGFDKKSNQAWIEGKKKKISIGIRLIQGDFPDFRKIIPTNFATKVVVDSENLLRSIKQMAVFARQSSNVVTWEIGDKVVLSTQESGGRGVSELEAKIEGDKLSIAFNFRYFQEYLNTINSGEVTLIFNGPLAPSKLISSNDPGFTHIIMPVKPQGD